MHSHILEHQKGINENLIKSYSGMTLADLLAAEEEKLIKSELAAEAVTDEIEKSDEDELEEILRFLEKGENPELFKSEDGEEFDQDSFEKGVVGKIHKYLKKVGNKYFYEKEHEVKPINEHRSYLSEKTTLDKLKTAVDGAKHSDINRESYKAYYKHREAFKTKHGHDHDSETAADQKKLTMHAMHNHIDNKVREIEAKQKKSLAKAEDENDIEKAKAFTIGQLDKSGRNVKTADGWKPVKTHGHLVNGGKKVEDSNKSTKDFVPPKKLKSLEEGKLTYSHSEVSSHDQKLRHHYTYDGSKYGGSIGFTDEYMRNFEENDKKDHKERIENEKKYNQSQKVKSEKVKILLEDITEKNYKKQPLSRLIPFRKKLGDVGSPFISELSQYIFKEVTKLKNENNLTGNTSSIDDVYRLFEGYKNSGVFGPLGVATKTTEILGETGGSLNSSVGKVKKYYTIDIGDDVSYNYQSGSLGDLYQITNRTKNESYRIWEYGYSTPPALQNIVNFK